MPTSLTPPAALALDHELDGFQSGVPELGEWLRKRDHKNERARTSRTFLVCEGNRVVGYYSLASGAIARTAAPKSMARNMPDPVPVLVLGRLAVDLRHQGKGIGGSLLRDAVSRAIRVSNEIGVKAILVHAISNEAKGFYLQYGFVESPQEPMTLCMALSSIE